MAESEDLVARVAELERLVAALADRVYAAHEVLANLAERKNGGGASDADGSRAGG